MASFEKESKILDFYLPFMSKINDRFKRTSLNYIKM